MRNIALNVAYAGKRSHLTIVARKLNGNQRRRSLGELTDAAWPALVSLEDFYNVRSLLLDPKRRTSRPGSAKHLLSMDLTPPVGRGLPHAFGSRHRKTPRSCRGASCPAGRLCRVV